MRGRKPKPTRLKLIEGNPGKRATNQHDLRPEPKVPTCPAHLCPAAKAEWKRLARELFLLGIVMDLDRAALAAYSQAYGRWAEAERKLKDTPVLIKLPSGYIQPSPWLGIGNKQLELMAKYVAELGLSPVSRTRVEAKPPYQRKPWEFGREWVDPRSKFAGFLGPNQDDPAEEYLP
jgi:P27 family predicted phage terminase small subunit